MTNRQSKIEGWTRQAVRGLKPYYKAPIDGNPLRLDQNTNLYGPNPALTNVVPPAADQYPTRDSDDLLAALATIHSLTPDHFVVGNGSDEILDFITKSFTSPGQTLAAPTPSYSLYRFYATLQDLQIEQIPLRSGFQLDVDGLLATGATMTIVASPNNPTGNAFPTADLERLIHEAKGVVVIDEAYGEFMPMEQSFLHRVDEFDNLIVMRTFSKAHGLAGLRVGYATANPDLIDRLRLVKPPFNLNIFSEAVAIAALAGTAWMNGVVEDTLVERERMGEILKKTGLRPYPSDANFIMFESDDDPGFLADKLQRAGILGRTFPGVAGLEQCIRFTVGRAEHTDQLLEALSA
jgi:histidinol-phosphate aminotransferase